MAEEPRKNKTTLSSISQCLNKAKWLPVGFLFLLSNVCFSAQKGSSALLSQVDLSVPLWGGGQVAMASMSQDDFVENEIKLHHFDELACGSCHQAPSGSGEEDWKSLVNINQSCTSFGCHEYNEKMNHPLDVVLPAGIRTGSEFSDFSSTVTCLSCHQPQEEEVFDGEKTQADVYLQDPALVGCDSCHSRMSGSMKLQSHWKFSQKAHLVSLTSGMFDDKVIDDLIFDIDSESNTCISCHDEVTVTIPAMNETRQQKAARFRNMPDHPIGMDYQYILSRNSMYFNSLMGMEKTIRMFDGKVGCGSCHSLYSDIPGNLVLDNENSAICHTCHNR